MTVAQNRSAQQRQVQPAQRSFLSRVILLPFSLSAVLLLSLLLSIIIEFCTMAIFYKHSYEHSQHVYNTELAYLNDDFDRYIVNVSPSKYAAHMSAQFDDIALNKLGFSKILESFKDSLFYNYLAAMLYTCKTFLLRVFNCVLFLPAFFLAATLGLVEGLVRRDLRRFGGGLEHAFLYHIFKRNLQFPLITAWLFYLSAPFSLHPNLVFVPAMLLFALMFMQTASLFKKYL